MSKAETLLDLQDNDSILDRLTKRLAEITAALHETEELVAARSARQAAAQVVTHQRTRRKDLELADASLETKIKQAEQRLYSGVVKNPKELLDLQNDIASLKRQKDALDDQLFNTMVALEEAEATLKTSTETDTHVEAEWRTSQGDLIQKQAEAEADLARHQQVQSELRAKLSAADLALYDQLRRRKSGLAVVELNGAMCTGCGVRAAAHIMQQINQEQMARCGNCERILVKI